MNCLYSDANTPSNPNNRQFVVINKARDSFCVYSVSGSWTEEVDCLRDGFDSSLTLRGGDDDEPEIPQRQRREDRSRYSSSNPAPLFSGRLRSGLSWRAFEAKTVLPNSVVGKASIPMFTTVGPRSSWKPARNVWPVMWYGKPHPTKLKICVAKHPP